MKCDLKVCMYNRDGKCLDKKSLKKPYNSTGCKFYDNKNIKLEKEMEKDYDNNER